MMFLVPSLGGAIVHKIPKWVPKKLGIILDAILKLLPIIILIITSYLVITQKKYSQIKKIEKENLMAELTAGIKTSTFEKEKAKLNQEIEDLKNRIKNQDTEQSSP